MIPITNYAAVESVMADITSDKKALQCHVEDCSTNNLMCKAMGDCNGQKCNARGICECDKGTFGADCSIKGTLVKTDGVDQNGTTGGIDWLHFYQESTDEDWNLDIKFQFARGGVNYDLYMLKDNTKTPNEFNYDLMMKSVSLPQITIAKETL